MKAKDYLYQKQLLWAKEKNLELEPAKDGSDKQYVKQSEDNFFPQERLSEIISVYPPLERDEHMRALISSSALVVNVFGFWENSANKVSQLASACGFNVQDSGPPPSEIRFEKEMALIGASDYRKKGAQPHLDIVFDNPNVEHFPICAVKSKFTEPYTTSSFDPFSDEYFKPAFDGLWSDIKELHKFAKGQRHQNFKHLNAAQLVQSILGLKTSHGEHFSLMYLYYDCFGEMNEEHRREIEEFTTIAKGDGIAFHAKTYQELLFDLYNKYGGAGEYKEYFDYVMGRYF